ncbi:2-oxoglutarate and iron-dependent oxygenase domain-containing protein [Acrasis kona]|uniref:2-oxoglutarate and iron-dependent oxygenase domain-containing protein n=1 Tax=Acrasis kona TaxID=1008807 RepID=A0AAW2YV55_9EUKA
MRDTSEFRNAEYKPIHEDLYKFDESFLVPSFVQAVVDAKKLLPLMLEFQKDLDNVEKAQDFNNKRREILSRILSPEVKNVYGLDIFTIEFCNKIIQEVKNYEVVHKVKLRPNSMNSYGVVIDELGLGPTFDSFLHDYFSPFAKIMNKGAYDLDDHHTFVVEYFIGGDLDLNLHVDDSEVTINVCLGVEGFKGGNVFFGGNRDKPETYEDYDEYENKVGRAIIHDGLHMHGALKLEDGERYNLIIWCRSKQYRRENPRQEAEIRIEHQHEHVHDENCGHEHNGNCGHVHDENCRHD